MQLTPIVLFTYNRPDHTRRTLDSLKANLLADQSELYIYCDGPKEGASQADLDRIKAVRALIREENWTAKVYIKEADANKGLARSIIDGVTEVVEQHGRVIVLEDDLLTSEFFLEYMNTALEKYAENEEVMQISGNMFQVDFSSEIKDSFFLPYTTTWGWAVWKRSWMHLDTSMKGYKTLKNDKNLRHKFDMGNTYPYFKMIENQINNRIDSWGIQWYLSVFVKQGLTLHPKTSLTSNIGWDQDSTHTKSSKTEKVYAEEVSKNSVKYYPESIQTDTSAHKEYIDFFRKVKSKRILLLISHPIDTLKKIINVVISRMYLL